MEKKYKTVQEMLEQIKSCKFTDEIGHPIELNVGFIELVELAYQYEELSEELKKTALSERL